ADRDRAPVRRGRLGAAPDRGRLGAASPGRGRFGTPTGRGPHAAASGRGPLGAAVGLVVGLLVLAPVLGRGVVLSYDMVFVPDPPITGSVLGTDGSVPRAVPTELLADLLARVLPVAVVQQGLLLAVFVLAGAGAARLAPGLPGA